MFAGIASKVVAAWRARVAVEAPSHLRDHPMEVTLTLLAALWYCREREIIDTLVELLISTVHRINSRAEVKVTEELIREFHLQLDGAPRSPRSQCDGPWRGLGS